MIDNKLSSKNMHVFGNMRAMVLKHGKEYHHLFNAEMKNGDKLVFGYTIVIPQGIESVSERISQMKDANRPEIEMDEYMKDNYFISKGRVSDPHTDHVLRRLAWGIDLHIYSDVENNRALKIQVPYIEEQNVFHGVAKQGEPLYEGALSPHVTPGAFHPICFLYYVNTSLEISPNRRDLLDFRLYTKKNLIRKLIKDYQNKGIESVNH